LVVGRRSSVVGRRSSVARPYEAAVIPSAARDLQLPWPQMRILVASLPGTTAGVRSAARLTAARLTADRRPTTDDRRRRSFDRRPTTDDQ
jgi:hypothetical protein